MVQAILAHVAMWIRAVTTSGLGCVILVMGLGCQSQPTARDIALEEAQADRAPSVTVLPSETQLALGDLTGVEALASHAGRRDGILGGRYQPPAEVRRRTVDVRDDQRVINGRVQSNLLWRIRSFDQRR